VVSDPAPASHQWSFTPRPAVRVEGSGPPIVLLHGWGASNELFGPVIESLRGRFRLIAPDFPGFGGTEPPPKGWASADYAEWVSRLLDDLGVRRCAVIGHSHGGRVAIRFAADYPDRVVALVLASSAGIKPEPTLRSRARVRAFKLFRRAAESPLAPARLRRSIRERVAQAGSADYRAATGTVRESLVRVVNEDSRPLLPRIRVPALLVWGDRDEDTPLSDARLMEHLIPDAGLVIFEGAGHYAYLEQSGRFCRIVDTFLGDMAPW
jgi:pimeloyl-ACP methyl ester carboxylesterase